VHSDIVEVLGAAKTAEKVWGSEDARNNQHDI